MSPERLDKFNFAPNEVRQMRAQKILSPKQLKLHRALANICPDEFLHTNFTRDFSDWMKNVCVYIYVDACAGECYWYQ